MEINNSRVRNTVKIKGEVKRVKWKVYLSFNLKGLCFFDIKFPPKTLGNFLNKVYFFMGLAVETS